MSVDDRLRRGLAANAETLAPRTEHELQRVRRRGRRLARARVAAGALLAAAAVAVPLLVVHPWQPEPPVVTPAPALSGRWTVDAGPGAPAPGHWEVTFRDDGLVEATAPAGYGGVVSGALFRAGAGTLRSNLFGEDVCSGDALGDYRWRHDGDRLVFTVRADDCAARTAFFTDSTWSSS